MKKKYTKPNICAIDFDILDIIHTSDPWNPSPTDPDDDDWLSFSAPSMKGKKSNGGFDGIGWY